MTGLDLTGVADFIVDQILVDDLQVQTDHLSAQAELDDETGKMTVPAPTLVWAGKGAVMQISGNGYSAVPDPNTQRVLRETNARYRALVGPADSEGIKPGQHLLVLSANGQTPDPQIADRLFKVVELSSVSTFAVVRFVYLEQVGRPDDFQVAEAP